MKILDRIFKRKDKTKEDVIDEVDKIKDEPVKQLKDKGKCEYCSESGATLSWGGMVLHKGCRRTVKRIAKKEMRL